MLSSDIREAAHLCAAVVLARICSTEAHTLVMAAGAAAPLVRLLVKSNRSAEVQKEAAIAISLLSCDDDNLPALFAAGAVEALIPLLSLASHRLQQQAVLELLENLAARMPASRTTLIDAGAVPPLVEMLHSDCEDQQCKSALVLACLATINQVCVATAGTIGPLVKLLASGSERVKLAAATALGNLAFNVSLHAEFTSASAVAPLVRLLRLSVCATIQEEAARVLMGLTFDNVAHARAAVAVAGGIPRLVRLLQCGSFVAQMAAVAVLTALAADGSPRDVSAMKKAGAVSLLIKLEGNADAEEVVRNGAATLLRLLQQSSDGVNPSEQQGTARAVWRIPPQHQCPPQHLCPPRHLCPSPCSPRPDPSADVSGPACTASPASLARGARQSGSKPKKQCWSRACHCRSVLCAPSQRIAARAARRWTGRCTRGSARGSRRALA